jgi:hypothetical protein
MLEKSEITKNFTKWVKTGQKHEFLTDELLNFIGEDLMTAPAGTSTDFPGAYEGGLVKNTLLVTKYAVASNASLPEDKQMDVSSIIKVCLLHQIGKAKLFVPKDSQWHNDRGIMYDFNEDLVSMPVGERSVLYCHMYGVKLSEEEFQAILNFNKTDDKQSKAYTLPLGQLLKASIFLASIEENE